MCPLSILPLTYPADWYAPLFATDSALRNRLSGGSEVPEAVSQYMEATASVIALLQKSPLQGDCLHLRKVARSEIHGLLRVLTQENGRQQFFQGPQWVATQPRNPYLILMIGLLMETNAFQTAGTACVNDVVVRACLSYLEAAVLGSDEAARRLARVALAYPNSPVAVERILDLFLAQKRRPLRHKMRFVLPGLPWLHQRADADSGHTGKALSGGKARACGCCQPVPGQRLS